jgi:hypothetical protein
MSISMDEVICRFLPLKDELRGYWTEPGFPDDERKSFSSEICTIGLNETSNTEEEIVSTLAHELQHYRQWTSGRLAIASSIVCGRRVKVWDGVIYNADPNRPYLEYLQSPWEQDARQTEVAIWNLYTQTYIETQQAVW